MKKQLETFAQLVEPVKKLLKTPLIGEKLVKNVYGKHFKRVINILDFYFFNTNYTL